MLGTFKRYWTFNRTIFTCHELQRELTLKNQDAYLEQSDGDFNVLRYRPHHHASVGVLDARLPAVSLKGRDHMEEAGERPEKKGTTATLCMWGWIQGVGAITEARHCGCKLVFWSNQTPFHCSLNHFHWCVVTGSSRELKNDVFCTMLSWDLSGMRVRKRMLTYQSLILEDFLRLRRVHTTTSLSGCL